MALKIFFSWQDKTDVVFNHRFIRDCIKAAIKRFRKEWELEKDYVLFEMDTTGSSGQPIVVEEIQKRIEGSDVYIADMTIVALAGPEGKKDGQISNNVSDEMGMARQSIGPERIVGVMNLYYGAKETLPFNYRPRRWPMDYTYGPESTPEEMAKAKEDLVRGLAQAIETIYINEMEKTKAHHQPFMNWQMWRQIIDRNFLFEFSDDIRALFNDIRLKIETHKTIFRVCALPGYGKTRMLFECFSNEKGEVGSDFTNKVLYIEDTVDKEEKIIGVIRDLIRRKEERVLIVDNADQEFHRKASTLVRSGESRLSLITISSNPDEKIRQFDPDRVTNLWIMDAQKNRGTVQSILDKYFPELDTNDKALLTEFSDGLPLMAAIMAGDTERDKFAPGTLSIPSIIDRLLGSKFTDPSYRAGAIACCLFSRFGYFDDFETHMRLIASSQDLFPLNLSAEHPDDHGELRINRFREICEHLRERQLLERKGRMYAFRPAPLSVALAEEFWRTCTQHKFERVIKSFVGT